MLFDQPDTRERCSPWFRFHEREGRRKGTLTSVRWVSYGWKPHWSHQVVLFFRRMSGCWVAVTDPQLLQTNSIDSFPRFFHGGYCRPQVTHCRPQVAHRWGSYEKLFVTVFIHMILFLYFTGHSLGPG